MKTRNIVQFQERGKLQKAFAIPKKQVSSDRKILVPYTLDKGLLPGSLGLVLRELGKEFPMCLAVDLRVYRSPISLSLISVIESAFRQFQNCIAEAGDAYLKPLLEYAAAAERMMWAVADLPTPRLRRLAMVVELSILPV